MKIVELINGTSNPFISFEIIPPMRGGSVQQVLDTVADLIQFEPPFIDVTSHAAEVYYEELSNGTMRRHVKRKRPGTIGLCAAIQTKFKIEAVPHLLCEGFTREETEDALIELNYLGIRNVMALRGDDKGYPKSDRLDRTRNEYACDLVAQIAAMNRGCYLEEIANASPTDFCIGVAGYPEKHFEAPNRQRDMLNLKQKISVGGHYITTQMFFDNQHYFNFVNHCQELEIMVPIIPGLKILSSKKHLQTIPQNFFVEIPEALAGSMAAAKPEHVADIGVEWTLQQAKELLSRGVPGLHFYIMSGSNLVKKVVEPLRKMA